MANVPSKQSTEMAPSFVIHRPTVNLIFIFTTNGIVLSRPLPPWTKDGEGKTQVLHYLRENVRAEGIDQEIERINNLFGVTPKLILSSSSLNEENLDEYLEQEIGFLVELGSDIIPLTIAPEIAATIISDEVITAFTQHQPIQITIPVGVRRASAQTFYVTSMLPKIIITYPAGAKPELMIGGEDNRD